MVTVADKLRSVSELSKSDTDIRDVEDEQLSSIVQMASVAALRGQTFIRQSGKLDDSLARQLKNRCGFQVITRQKPESTQISW